MSVTGNSRPRIPPAFMPAGWVKSNDICPESFIDPSLSRKKAQAVLNRPKERKAHPLAQPPTPPDDDATHAAYASLRRMHQSWRRRKDKDRQASKASHPDEELVRRLTEHHRLAMVHICQAEDKAYESRWANLGRRGRPPYLWFHQVPWPLLTPIIFSPAEITLKTVRGFLTSPFRKPTWTSREKVLEEMARWEAGVFETVVVESVVAGEKDRVREGGERVRATLRQLLASLKEKGKKWD